MPVRLRPHVSAMFGYRAHGLEPGVHRGLPSPGLTLVLSLGRPLVTAPDARAWDAGVRDRQWVSLGGLHTEAAMVENPGWWAGVQLTLHPLGLRRLLGVPAADLPVGSWDAADLLGGEVDRVAEELGAARCWSARYAVVHAFLARLQERAGRAAEPPPPRPEVRQAWRLLTAGTPPTVDEVAREVGYSRRRLGELFAAEVGHGPKTVQRLARFDAARRAVPLAAARGAPLATVAAAAGYCDQSHLVREFRQYAGLSPTRWLAAELPNVQAPAGPAAPPWDA